MKQHTLTIGLALIIGCTTSLGPAADEEGERDLSRYAVRYDGPELVAAVGFHLTSEGIGDEWLILALQVTSSKQGGSTVIHRDEITARTPDGRRIALLTQDEYRKNSGRFRILVGRTLSFLPLIKNYERSQTPCRRWFLEEPGGGTGLEAIPVNNLQVCSGPLVFKVPGSVQPGRWRLVIELEESTADIPFVVEDGD